jgi:hypothetical protein
MDTQDLKPTYLTICRNVRADAFILGIEPEDESEQAVQKGRELIAKHCHEHKVDEFAFTAWLFN